MKRPNLVAFGFIFSLSLLASGCGGGGTKASTGTQTPTSFQFISPTSAPSIDAGQSVTFTVNEPVATKNGWTLQAGLGQIVGTLGNETSTSATYTAPSSVSGSTQVTVVATLMSDPTQSASIPVFINPALAASGSFNTGTAGCAYDPISQPRTVGYVGVQYGVNNPPGTLSAAAPMVGAASGGTPPYSWSVSSGSLPTGTGWVALGQYAGEAYLYGTPVSAGCWQVTFQATDATGATATTTTENIIIAPPQLKLQAPNYPDLYSSASYPPTAFTVAGGVPPYKWNLAGTSVQGVTLTPDSSNSSVAVMWGTPAACNTNCNSGLDMPYVYVEDSETFPASALVQLNQNQWKALPTNACTPNTSSPGAGATSNPANMSGAYAFLLRGFDANGPVVMAGSFVADGMGGVAGEEDIMRATGSQTKLPITGSYLIIEQGTYTTTFYQGGCLTLNAQSGTTTFAISLGGCTTGADPTTGLCALDSTTNLPGLYTTGRLIEFDDSTGSGTRASGIIRMQESGAVLSGGYSFGLSGWDSAGSRYAAAGSMSASSSALNSIAADINDGGALQLSLTGGSGTSSAPDTNGRVAATMMIGTASLNLAFYVVSAQEALVVSTGAPSASNPFVSGEAISAAGPFSAASLQNSHIFHIGGVSLCSACTPPTTLLPDPSIGILSFDGVSSVIGTQYEDQAGTIGTTALSGGYTVNATTGRVAFTVAPNTTQNLGDHPLVGYVVPVPSSLTRQNCVKLASCVTGFLLSTDATAQAGQLEFQTPMIGPPPPFSIQNVTGYYFYGTDESLDNSTALVAGASNADPTGAVYAGLQSASYPNSNYSTYCQPNCALLLPNEAIGTGTYSVGSSGTATIGGGTVGVTNGNVTYYIDESPLNSHPSVTVVEQ